MAVTVICRVPPTVKKTPVTYRTEHASRVRLGGSEVTVTPNAKKDGLVSIVSISVQNIA